MEIRETLVNRFYDYVAIPSQSCANGGTKVPSTEGQWDMARAVQKDLERLGLEDIHLSEYGVLTAPAGPSACRVHQKGPCRGLLHAP